VNPIASLVALNGDYTMRTETVIQTPADEHYPREGLGSPTEANLDQGTDRLPESAVSPLAEL
jgi:hypothetical protein